MLEIGTGIITRAVEFEAILRHREAVVAQVVQDIERTQGGIFVIRSGMKAGKSTAADTIAEQVAMNGYQVAWYKPAFLDGKGNVIAEDSNTIIRKSFAHNDVRIRQGTLLREFSDLDPRNNGGASDKRLYVVDEAMLVQSPGSDEYRYVELQKEMLSFPWEEHGVHLLVTGLDHYHDGTRWESTWRLMEKAKAIYRLYALCEAGDGQCLTPAAMTQRVLDGVPWLDGPAVVVRSDGERSGAATADYIAVCKDCHVGIQDI